MNRRELTHAERFTPAEYDSRLDRFMREKTTSVSINEWARQTGLRRTAFNKQRLPTANPRGNTVAKLVRAATRILGRRVMATELFDVGEDTAVGRVQAFDGDRRGRWQREFDSRLGGTLARIGIGPAELQHISGVTKTSISRICNNRVSPRISIVRSLVAALRRAGYEVRARDVADVGDDPPPRSTRRYKTRPRSLI
jgi:hypothetical protein